MEIISRAIYEMEVNRCYGDNSAQRHEIHSSSLHFLLTAISILSLHLRLRAGSGVRGNFYFPHPRESQVVLLGPLGQFCDLCVYASMVHYRSDWIGRILWSREKHNENGNYSFITQIHTESLL